MKYIQKPIEVEAWQWDGSKDLSEAPAWIHEAEVIGKIQITANYKGRDTYMTVHKKHGSLRVFPGHYIVKGVRGGIYPCKPDTFLASHERI